MEVKSTIKNLKVFLTLLPFTFLLFTFSGCAHVMENAVESVKVVAGLSTKELEAARPKAAKKTFNYDYKACYEKAREFAAKKEFYLYAKDKQMIALYLNSDPVPEMSTTPVGLFFKEIDANNTQVEVASQSAYAKELIAERLFAVLEGKKDPEEEKREKMEKEKKDGQGS